MKPRTIAVLLFLIALAVRVLHLMEIRTSPLVQQLLIDSRTYDALARRILEGRFHGEDVYSMNVLYPYFLAAVYAVTRGGVLAALAVQAVLDALTCVLVFRLGLRLFDRRVAVVAGLLAAFYGPMVFYSGALLTPTLITFLVVAGLWILDRHRVRPRARTAFLGGLVLGLGALGRGNVLLFLVLAPIYFLIVVPERRRALGHWAALAAGFLLLAGGVTVRNALVEGRFVPVAANYAAFYIGHNPEATGLYHMPSFTPGASYEEEVWGTRAALSDSLGRNLTLAETSSYLFGRGVHYALGHPGREAVLSLRKLWYFWNNTESPTNLNLYFARDFSAVLRFLVLGFGLVAPLGLLGIWIARGRWKRHAALHLMLLVQVLTAILFFVSAEYRLPAVPILMLFAAGAVVGIATGTAWRSWREAGVFALAAVVLAAACNLRDPLLRAQSWKRVDYLNFGRLYLDGGNLPRARDMLERSLAIDPRYSPAYASLAEVAHRSGNDLEAARLADLAARYRVADGTGETGPTPEETGGLLQAARLYRSRNYPAALKAFLDLRATAVREGDSTRVSRLENNIGLCRYKLGDLAAAESTFAAIVARDPGYVKAHNNLGMALAAGGKIEAAVREYETTLRLDPGNRMARRELGRLRAVTPPPQDVPPGN